MGRFRYLYVQLVRRELRQKYKGSVLGVLWYLVNPLAIMAAYWLMFSLVLDRDDIADYPLFLLVGITIWVFFSQSLMAAASSLIDQSALVRKVRFPREVIPASVVTVPFSMNPHTRRPAFIRAARDAGLSNPQRAAGTRPAR